MKKNILVIATHNSAKYAQLQSLLKDSGFQLISLTQLGITHDVEETGTTFQENAILKAKTYAKLSGYMTLADDSGLEVDALGGEPGVYSKRYAGENATGEQKIQFMLDKLIGVPEQERTVCFTSVVAVATPEGDVQTFEGTMNGFITTQAYGPHIPNFPYCSIFLVPEHNKTITQLVAEGKHFGSSHRVIAVKKALAALRR